jgi:hypothetical protein
MRVSKYVFALLFGLLAFGCGGGGSGGGTAATGSITVLIGDGPIENLDEAWLTVRELRLNMAGGNNHVVLDTPQTIELLQLHNLTEVLLMEQIVTGKVNKIRLLLDDLEIVRMDGSMDMLPVPAGGWVELNPQGGFDVRAGETIYVMIDVDMKRSVQVVEGGNGDLNFRPQVFAEIYAHGDESRLVRLKGTARGVNDTVGSWDLCDLRREAGDGGSNNNLYDCVRINDGNAVVVENGDVLEENVTVTAFGFMAFDEAEDTMNAKVLVTGTDEPIVSESGRALAIPPNPMVIEQFTDDEAPMEFNFAVNLLPDWKSFPGVTDPATTGEVMLDDDIEALGFSTGATSMDAFLFVYKRPGS